MAVHKPVLVEPRVNKITCKCAWSSKEHAHLDAAWDEYDDHTME